MISDREKKSSDMYHHVGGGGRKHTPVVCNESREPQGGCK